jgi:hypothetical protein
MSTARSTRPSTLPFMSTLSRVDGSMKGQTTVRKALSIIGVLRT